MPENSDTPRKVRRIRSSMLPSHPDCGKRTIAKQWPELIAAKGFTLRKLLPSVGAAVGTAAHKAVEFMLKGMISDGALGDLDEGVAHGVAEFRREIEPGAEWDDTTPSRAVAEQQIKRLAEAYLPIVDQIRPVAVELPLRAAIAPGWELTGTIDLYDGGPPPGPDDFKTGAVRRPYHGQIGGYSLLLKSNGKPVERAGITHAKRVRLAKPQPPAERTEYDVLDCERVAMRTIHAIISDVKAFEASGDPFDLPANPMSLMCTPRYCPAWGTDLCTVHLEETKDYGAID